MRIYRIPADGGPAIEISPRSLDAGDAAWSPDGSMIAYAAFDPERAEVGFDIVVANADGSGQRRLADGPYWDVAPFWSADGRTIYYLVDPGTQGGLSLAAIPVEGREPRWLLDNVDRNLFLARDPGRGELYFTRIPTGNQFVTVDIGKILDGATGMGGS
jgi:Tol biopolymer transport system component